MLHPMTPPPMMTMRVALGMLMAPDLLPAKRCGASYRDRQDFPFPDFSEPLEGLSEAHAKTAASVFARAAAGVRPPADKGRSVNGLALDQSSSQWPALKRHFSPRCSSTYGVYVWPS